MENLDDTTKNRIKESGDFIEKVTSPQINAYTTQYNQLLKDLIFNAGIFAGAAMALLSSSIEQKRVFSIAGLILIVLSIIFAVLGFRRSLLKDSDYILLLKKLEGMFSDRSSLAISHKAGVLNEEGYKSKDRELVEKIYAQLDAPAIEEVRRASFEFLENMKKPWSEINIVTYCFILGILLLILSVTIPFFDLSSLVNFLINL